MGDKQSISKHYPAMKKWIAYMKGKYINNEGLMTKDSYGDWCVPPESPELIHAKDSSRITNPQLIATAYYYYLLQLMSKFASLTNNPADCATFDTEAAKVKIALNKKFYNQANGSYGKQHGNCKYSSAGV
jgi:alpha-L-rhamnosidase